jgi:hypothetical protein
MAFLFSPAKKTTEVKEEENPMAPFVLSDMKKYEAPSVDLFLYFKKLITTDVNGWSTVLQNKDVHVSSKATKWNKVNILRVRAEFKEDASFIADLVKVLKYFH